MKKFSRDPVLTGFKKAAKAIRSPYRGRQLSLGETQRMLETLDLIWQEYFDDLEATGYEAAFGIALHRLELAIETFQHGDNSYDDVDNFFIVGYETLPQIFDAAAESESLPVHDLLAELIDFLESPLFDEAEPYRTELFELASGMDEDEPCQRALLTLASGWLKKPRIGFDQELLAIRTKQRLLVKLHLLDELETFAEEYFRKCEQVREWLYEDRMTKELYGEAEEIAKAALKLGGQTRPYWKKALAESGYKRESTRILNGMQKISEPLTELLPVEPPENLTPESDEQLLDRIRDNWYLVEDCPPELAQVHPQEIFEIYSRHLFQVIQTSKGAKAQMLAAEKVLHSQTVLGEKQAKSLISHMKKTFKNKKKFIEALQKFERPDGGRPLAAGIFTEVPYGESGQLE